MEWVEFYKHEPFTLNASDSLSANICALIANTKRDPEKRPEPFEISDFTLFSDPKPEKILTDEEIEQLFMDAWGR